MKNKLHILISLSHFIKWTKICNIHQSYSRDKIKDTGRFKEHQILKLHFIKFGWWVL